MDSGRFVFLLKYVKGAYSDFQMTLIGYLHTLESLIQYLFNAGSLSYRQIWGIIAQHEAWDSPPRPERGQ